MSACWGEGSAQGSACLPEGCLSTGGVSAHEGGAYLPGGQPAGGCLPRGGVCLPMGVSAQRGHVCLPGGICLPHPTMNRMTDTWKNITLPQLRCGR